MDLAAFKSRAGDHTQVTVRNYPRMTPPATQKREVTRVTAAGIHSRLPWADQPPFFIDWPHRHGTLGFEITGHALTWTNRGSVLFSYTFPHTLAEAEAAAYDPAGHPRTSAE